jgi:hypothetical protein
MSFYNMVFGVKPAAFFVMPFIGVGYHPDQWPRFRDCFIGDDEHPEYVGKIIVYTRTGGGNREHNADANDWIRSLPGFVADYDDSYDCTFACWVFDVPEEWAEDVRRFLGGDVVNYSPAARERVLAVYPKLVEKLAELWNLKPIEENQ